MGNTYEFSSAVEFVTIKTIIAISIMEHKRRKRKTYVWDSCSQVIIAQVRRREGRQ